MKGTPRALHRWLPWLLLLALVGCNLPQAGAIAAAPTMDLTAAYVTVSALLTPTEDLAPGATPVPPEETATPPGATPTPPPDTQEGPPCNMAAAAPHVDITVPDGTVLRPGQPFTKIWRLINAGACPWTPDYAVVWFAGARLGAPPVVPLGVKVPPGQAVDLAVDMVAPLRPGAYISYWKLRDAKGRLFGIGPGEGSPFWVSIVVQVPGTVTPTDTPTPTQPPTRTPTFTPSPTPVVHAEGTLHLAPDDQVDLDNLQPGSSGADVAYILNADEGHALRPLNGAWLGVYGLSAPSPQACAQAAKAQVSIPLEPLSPGTYLCVLTDQGRLGRLRYLGIPNDTLDLEAEIWEGEEDGS